MKNSIYLFVILLGILTNAQTLGDFKPGKAYVLNTRKQHGSFAFEGGIYHILMSLYLTEENIKSIHKLLPNTMGDKK